MVKLLKEKFFHPGDIHGAKGSALSSAIAEIKEWNKFRKLLPILTCRGLPLGAKWILYFAYLPIAILYGYMLSYNDSDT